MWQQWQHPARHVGHVDKTDILPPSALEVDSHRGDIPSHPATGLDGEPIGPSPPATELEGDPTQPRRRLPHPNSPKVHHLLHPMVEKVLHRHQ